MCVCCVSVSVSVVCVYVCVYVCVCVCMCVCMCVVLYVCVSVRVLFLASERDGVVENAEFSEARHAT